MRDSANPVMLEPERGQPSPEGENKKWDQAKEIMEALRSPFKSVIDREKNRQTDDGSLTSQRGQKTKKR
jgi:hypothetical protein